MCIFKYKYIYIYAWSISAMYCLIHQQLPLNFKLTIIDLYLYIHILYSYRDIVIVYHFWKYIYPSARPRIETTDC